jgi:hypothetical protein
VHHGRRHPDDGGNLLLGTADLQKHIHGIFPESVKHPPAFPKQRHLWFIKLAAPSGLEAFIGPRDAVGAKVQGNAWTVGIDWRRVDD